jgi:hypothetical protein
VAQGFEGHGLAGGPFYTNSQIQAFRRAEEKEMEFLVGSLNKDTANEDEMDELVRDIRVRFEPQKPHLRVPREVTQPMHYYRRPWLPIQAAQLERRKVILLRVCGLGSSELGMV